MITNRCCLYSNCYDGYACILCNSCYGDFLTPNAMLYLMPAYSKLLHGFQYSISFYDEIFFMCMKEQFFHFKACSNSYACYTMMIIIILTCTVYSLQTAVSFKILISKLKFYGIFWRLMFFDHCYLLILSSCSFCSFTDVLCVLTMQ